MKFEPMPERFHRLTRYNTEREHGLAHSAEYERQMGDLQKEYDHWHNQMLKRQGYIEISPNIWQKEKKPNVPFRRGFLAGYAFGWISWAIAFVIMRLMGWGIF